MILPFVTRFQVKNTFLCSINTFMILKSKHILIHLILSISFLMIPYVFIAGDMFRLPHVFHNPHDRFTLFVYFVMLGFFYFNYYYLLPTYYLKKQSITYFSIIAFILVFLITFYWWVDIHHLLFSDPHHL